MESGRENAEVNGAVKESPAALVTAAADAAVSAASKADEDTVRNGRDDSKQLADNEEDEMGKQNGEEELDESAQERMLKDETAAKITQNEKSTEVKFISENGDAKIDIETIKEAISGMSKEELMKFANDPFWIKLRWALFILFWLLWAAMLGGAVAIIVMAPKCSAPEPKKIWEESAIVQLDPSDSSSNNLKGLESILDDLKDQHIKAISLSSLVTEDENGGVIDFKVIKRELGDNLDLENLIKKAKDNEQQIFLELDPNHSSVQHRWFKQSVERQEPFTDYYVWTDGITSADNGKERRSSPNNWLSVYGESAWEWNEQRGQYYLHQFNKSQPDLNYNNPAVVKEFEDVLAYWLKLGISGFRLANTQYLMEDPHLRDEAGSIFPVEPGTYLSLTHIHTRDRPENVEVLARWHEIVHNKTDGNGLFSLQDDIGADILQVYNEKKPLIDLPQSSYFLATANASINATVLRKGVTQWLPIAPWPAWNLNGKHRTLRQRMPAEVANSLTLMTMLLPGTPILRLSDVVSARDAFATLSGARSSLTFLYGDTTTRIVNGTVFVYARTKSGNPGYLVAYQTGEDRTVIDLSTIQKVSEEVTVFAHSPNYLGQSEVLKTKLPSNAVPISPKSTVVLTFVPKE